MSSTGASLLEAFASRDNDLEASVARGHVMAGLFGDEAQHRRLGRYRLRRLLGRGAHGQVFEAFDPELDRLVAIKVVRNDDGDLDQRHARRIREAQALARLGHPNVVDVYDVGVHDGAVFIVMELVDGDDLARFVKAVRPPLSALVTAFVAAGRGLAAAHQVGLVHRDFKSSNVLVGKNAVKVADFGLARAVRAPSVDGGTTDPLDHAGTPIYMPPEQLRGEAVSAASDQYAWCAAFWESASGSPPFDATSPSALLAAKQRGVEGRMPQRLPRRLGKALRRGLAPDPSERYPSMDALLAAIERSVRGPTRMVSIGLSAVAMAVVAVGLSSAAFNSALPCELAAQSPLNRPMRAALSQRLSGTSLSAAEADLIVDDVAAYAIRWDSTRDSACNVQGTMRDAVVTCLDVAAVELQATLSGLVDAGSDMELVIHAKPAIHDLPDPESCLQPAAPHRRPPSVAATEVMRALARAHALQRLGKPDRALAAAETALPYAADLDAGLQARVGWELGRAYAVVGREHAANKHLAAAFYSARAASYPATAVRAAAMLADLSLARDDLEATQQWLRHATAVLARVEDDSLSRITVLRSRANLLLARDRFSDARVLLDEALALSDGDGLEASPVFFTRAQVNERLGDLEAAEADLRRALAIENDRLGPDHPEVISSHAMLGMVLVQLERHELAREEIEIAMALGQRWLPPLSADMARLHESLGIAALARGESSRAADDHARALEIRRAILPEQHPAIASSLHNVGLAASAAGRFAEAVASHRKALERFEVIYETGNHPQIVEALTALAAALRGAGRAAEAVPLLRRAQTILSASPDPTVQAAEVAATLTRTLIEANASEELIAAAADRTRRLNEALPDRTAAQAELAATVRRGGLR